ncbi:hypothetical protein [Sphingobacterium faecium]
MKLKYLFVAITLCFASISKVNAKTTQDLRAFVTEQAHADVWFYEVLVSTGIFNSTITEVQIADFERIYQPALQLIREVDISGLTRTQAFNAYNIYLANHPDLSIQLSLGIDGGGVPYLYRLIDEYMDKGNSAVGFLDNIDWYFSGYVIK